MSEIGGNPVVTGSISLDDNDVEEVVWKENDSAQPQDVYKIVLDGETIWERPLSFEFTISDTQIIEGDLVTIEVDCINIPDGSIVEFDIDYSGSTGVATTTASDFCEIGTFEPYWVAAFREAEVINGKAIFEILTSVGDTVYDEPGTYESFNLEFRSLTRGGVKETINDLGLSYMDTQSDNIELYKPLPLWNDIGRLDGTRKYARAGRHYDSNYDGTFLAVQNYGDGVSNIIIFYSHLNGVYTQLNTLNTITQGTYEYEPFAVELNASGNRALIGFAKKSEVSTSEVVGVFDVNTTTGVYTQIGDFITSISAYADDEITNSFEKYSSLSINDSGDTITIPYRYTAANGEFYSMPKILEYNGSSWVEKGDPRYLFTAEETYSSCKIDSTGNIIVVGTRGPTLPDNDLSVRWNYRPQILVLEYNNGAWVIKGNPILTDVTDSDEYYLRDNDRYMCDISLDGNTIAVGTSHFSINSKYVNLSAHESGAFYIFKFENGDWVKKTRHTGFTSFDRLGEYIKISGDGKTAVCSVAYDQWYDPNLQTSNATVDHMFIFRENETTGEWYKDGTPVRGLPGASQYRYIPTQDGSMIFAGSAFADSSAAALPNTDPELRWWGAIRTFTRTN